MKIRRLFPAVVACASVAVAWLATPPPARADCQQAAFLVVVVAAFVGYDRLSR